MIGLYTKDLNKLTVLCYTVKEYHINQTKPLRGHPSNTSGKFGSGGEVNQCGQPRTEARSGINRMSTIAKYFVFRRRPLLVYERPNRIARIRLKRKIFCVLDFYVRYDPDVSERGGGGTGV